ncbi:MAG: ABC transporter permease [Chloroflexi bacterium]|nr:ABC transporter permease [Chloroflexota bacterium]
MSGFRQQFRELLRHRSVLIGAIIIAGLIGLSIYAVIAIPYNEAISLWRGEGGVWDDSPRNAQPVWVNLFSSEKLPETIVLDTKNGTAKKTVSSSGDINTIILSMPFYYNYDGFPDEITLFFNAKFKQVRPAASISWLAPDGREIALGERSLSADNRYNISQDQQLIAALGSRTAETGLFANPTSGGTSVQKGSYEMVIKGMTFEKSSDIDARLVVYGKVKGVAGTDDHRRDLSVALLWGAPVAMAFGLLGAVGSTVVTLFIAAVGVWYGGLVDSVIQRLTELNAILPGLPILILIATFYSRSIVVILLVVVLLGIFSLGIKVYRSIFLQVKSLPYIEAARAYGASDMRIILLYMIPKVLPVLIPQLVLLIPSMVFLEASLAFLGLGDPILPTWGKVLNDAFQSGALYKGYYNTVVLPSILLILTGLGFAMLGYGLDRIFNPRLRAE